MRGLDQPNSSGQSFSGARFRLPFRARALFPAGLAAVLLVAAIGKPASALTLLTYDFTEGGYSNGSIGASLSGSFTGVLELNGVVDDVSFISYQFALSDGRNSRIFGNKSLSFFSFDTASGTLEILGIPDRRSGAFCINAAADGCEEGIGSLNFGPVLGTFTTGEEPDLRLVQSVSGVIEPPPPIPPPPAMAVVPEASTWSMLAIGFAALGFACSGARPRTPVALRRT